MEAADAVHTLLEGQREGIDPAIALYVNAGIAAADFLCCARLGVHAKGESHAEAQSLLSRVDRKLAGDLGALLKMKPLAAYSHVTMTGAQVKRAQRAARRLLDAATAVRGGYA